MRDLSRVVVHVQAPVGYTDTDKELQLRLSRQPADASEYADRAAARVLKGNYDGALDDLDHALQLKPDNADYLNSRCFTRGIANRALDQALSDCNAALEQTPTDSAKLDSRGFVYFRTGQLDKALEDLNAALKTSPKQAPTLFVRGLIELRNGDRRQGDADIAAAKLVDPTVAATYAKYGVTK